MIGIVHLFIYDIYICTYYIYHIYTYSPYIYISISWISDHGMPLSKPRAGYVLNDKHPKTIRVACDRHLGRPATFGHLQYPMEFVAGNESFFWLSYISLKIRYIHICLIHNIPWHPQLHTILPIAAPLELAMRCLLASPWGTCGSCATKRPFASPRRPLSAATKRERLWGVDRFPKFCLELSNPNLVIKPRNHL